MRRLLRFFAPVLSVFMLVGCSTGSDAVATGGGFQFVAPGGQQIIHYEPPEARGTLRSFSGQSLIQPGKVQGIQNYPDTVLVINVWGAWCTICRTEMADLQYIHAQMAGRGADVLGVDIRDTPDAARDFLQGVGVTYDSIYDPPGRVLSELNGYPRNVVPSTIVLDRRHRVAVVYLMRIPLAGLVALVNRLKGEPLRP